MMFKNIEDWIPADNLSLEENALITVKSNYNTLVVAGPGAGKTELLAQRASFLLETNSCVYPRKILAISFKRDAAYNLKTRVDKRCGETLSKRFSSLTFDAFAKSILDQFYRALPKEYKVNYPFDVVADNEVLELYKRLGCDCSNASKKNKLLKTHNDVFPIEDNIAKKGWKQLLIESKLSFKMIMRLSQLLIESNPKIKRYLQQTYSHIFLDEFQDTTSIQFEFLSACFGDSKAVFTAVGDDKQRIMLWAGAQPDIFDSYLKKYQVQRLVLAKNFRSAPKLVALQNHLIKELLHKNDIANASETWNKEDGEAYVWLYNNQQTEKEHLLEQVKHWIDKQKLEPRDICILVKQQLGLYAGEIIEYFNLNGVRARDESQFQDLLSDDFMIFILNTISLSSGIEGTHEKTQALNFLINISSIYENSEIIQLENKFNQFINKLIQLKLEPKELIDEIIKFASVDRIKANFPNYRNPKFLEENLKKLIQFLDMYFRESQSIYEVIQKILGKDSIPIMTIHKSKGLEYNTVIFIGLEDNAFWSFSSQPDEDKCAFFVALSRAKERVVFTFSETRINRFGKIEPQKFNNIKVIFDELENSSIVEFTVIE